MRIVNSTVGGVTIGKVTLAADPQSNGQNDICGDTFSRPITYQGTLQPSPIWNVGGCGANTTSGSG